MTTIRVSLINAYELAFLVRLAKLYVYYRKVDNTVSNSILKTILYVLLGILQSIKIVLGSFPDDKRAQDIITVLASLVTLIQDALEQPEMWLD